MIGFAISKMNLLIFVTAIFVIVTYFAFGIADLMLSQRANYVVETFSKEAAAIINSSAEATEKILPLPPKIVYFGGKEFYYVMKISHVPGEEVGERQTHHIVFSIASRKDHTKIIASRRIDTFAEPHLWAMYKPDFEQLTGGIEACEGDEPLIMDPQSRFEIDSFIIVKTTAKGKEYVYFSNCSSAGTGGTCDTFMRQLHKKITKETGSPYWVEEEE